VAAGRNGTTERLTLVRVPPTCPREREKRRGYGAPVLLEELGADATRRRTGEFEGREGTVDAFETLKRRALEQAHVGRVAVG